ncbi:MAG: arsenate reductase [Alphaproteobacteria bacterium]|nr:arsenate reductase [Alphaproteobacteria bacterium]
MVRLYGLKNCDSCKSAAKALDAAGLAYEFIDFKKSPPDAATTARWAEAVGAKKLVNRGGTTWRKLDEGAQALADAEEGAAMLVKDNPSLAKRPVIEHDDGAVTVGFDQAVKAKLGLGAD